MLFTVLLRFKRHSYRTFNSHCHAYMPIIRLEKRGAFIAAGFVTDAVVNKHEVPCVLPLNAHKYMQQGKHRIHAGIYSYCSYFYHIPRRNLLDFR